MVIVAGLVLPLSSPALVKQAEKGAAKKEGAAEKAAAKKAEPAAEKAAAKKGEPSAAKKADPRGEGRGQEGRQEKLNAGG